MHPDLDPPRIMLEDQSLRDGLQLESRLLSLEEKLRVFELLKHAGVPRIQAGSFVHPRLVPQTADTDDLIRAIGRQEETIVSALVLNGKGLERALACGVRHLGMSVSVSDTHSRKNTGRPAAEALESMTGLIREALASGVEVTAGLQCAFGCVYEGPIAVDAVLAAAEKMAGTGVREISLADTTGMASPIAVREMVRRINRTLPEIRVGLHLHDTRGLGLANLFAGYEAGIRTFDTCAGGLGGCPFVKGAAGNVPTEDAVHLFESMGVQTGIDLTALCKTVSFLESVLERRLPGRVCQAISFHRGPCGSIRE
ncbi:MAG: hydroxymethylglutaryl-CoA lyase [Desulfobacterales bacterium]